VLLFAFISLISASLYGFVAVDDAFITFRYARNVIEGNGFVYNVGEYVEGYTSFTWLLVCVLAYSIASCISVPQSVVVTIISIALAVTNLILVYELAKRIYNGRQVYALMATALLIADDVFLVNTLVGMECQLLLFFLLISIGQIITKDQNARRPKTLGVTLALLIMTRPDAVLLVGALLGYEFLRWRQRESQSFFKSDFLCTSCICISTYSAYLFWRVWYYGQFLPNTFYVKTGLPTEFHAWDRGLTYLFSYLENEYYVPVIAVFAGLFLLKKETLLLSAILIVHTLYITYIGGDFYPFYRFFAVLAPLVSILCPGILLFLTQGKKSTRVGVASVLLLAVFLFYKGFYSEIGIARSK
jgi:hypothetical protein